MIAFSNNALSFFASIINIHHRVPVSKFRPYIQIQVSLESDWESGSLPKNLGLQNQRRKIGIIKQSLQVIK